MRRKALVAAILFAGFAGATQATPGVSPDTIFNRLKAYWHEHDLDAPFQSAEPLGDDGVLFRNIAIEGKEAPAEGQFRPSLKIDSIAVTGLAPLGKDGFTARAFQLGKVAIEFPADGGKTLAIAIEPSGGTGLNMVPSDSSELPFSRTMPTVLRLGALTATLGGQEVFAMTGAESSVWFDESGDLLTMKSSMPQASIPLDVLPSAGRAQLDALGMAKLAVSITSSGAWNIPAGRMTLEEYRIALEGAGSMTLSMTLEGYSLDWYRRAREAAGKSQDGTDVEAQQQEAAQMMAILGELKLASLKLDFRDGAITRRLLAIQAEAMGMTADELAGSIPPMISGYLALARNEQFSSQAADAVQTFLKDPGAISLSLTPARPVPVTEIVGALLNAPEKLVPMLGAKIAANR